MHREINFAHMKSSVVTAARKEMEFRLNEANEWAQLTINERSSESDVRAASERLADAFRQNRIDFDELIREIVENIPTEETYGIAFAKESTELAEEVNKGLKKAIEDGSYATVYEKWFSGAPPLAELEEAIETAESK